MRFNRFPSHATFKALIASGHWQAGKHNRDAALAETYALMTLPEIDEFDKEIGR